MNPLDRRRFLQSAALGTTALMVSATAPAAAKPKLRLAVKYGMIAQGRTPLEKFKLANKIGFEGVEVDSPSGLDKEAVKRAIGETGVVIHGVVDAVHWRDTLSHAREDIRAKGLNALKGALADAAFFGADTVLLVPGVVNKEVTFEECWERSTAEIRKALPEAEKLKVKIAIEVVWNNFLTTPEQLIKYVDQFESRWVGAYFDCSNVIKYGVPSAEWIKRLGKRMLKFDFKGYSKTKQWVPIGEGDEDWPAILAALDEIGYNGWATAEVTGGLEKDLRDVYERMRRVLRV